MMRSSSFWPPAFFILGSLPKTPAIVIAPLPQSNGLPNARCITARQIGLELASACSEETAPAWQDADASCSAAQAFEPRPDPLAVDDLIPWLLRRLTLATAMARELQHAASLAQQRKPAV